MKTLVSFIFVLMLASPTKANETAYDSVAFMVGCIALIQERFEEQIDTACATMAMELCEVHLDPADDIACANGLGQHLVEKAKALTETKPDTSHLNQFSERAFETTWDMATGPVECPSAIKEAGICEGSDGLTRWLNARRALRLVERHKT